MAGFESCVFEGAGVVADLYFWWVTICSAWTRTAGYVLVDSYRGTVVVNFVFAPPFLHTAKIFENEKSMQP